MECASVKLSTSGFGMMCGLLVQYALGMYVNLFVSFPDASKANIGVEWVYAWHHPPVAAHIIIAILLTLNAIVIVVRAVKTKNGVWKKWSVAGLICILLAAFAGSQFIPTQLQRYSYIMSIAFILAFSSYAIGVYTSHDLFVKK